MNRRILTLLLEGAYICPYRYPDEFLLLQDEGDQEQVNDWLSKLNMRLARLGDDGAFFMAPDYLGQKDVTQVKTDLMRFRDEYGPAVLFLDFVRQTDAGRYSLSPGEYIALYDLDTMVSTSTMLETQLKALYSVISGASNRQTNHENLRRLLEHLAKEGYVVLADRNSGTYRVTGKVDQIYMVLQFLDENKVIPDSEVDDRETEDSEGSLFDTSADPEADAHD